MVITFCKNEEYLNHTVNAVCESESNFQHMGEGCEKECQPMKQTSDRLHKPETMFRSWVILEEV